MNKSLANKLALILGVVAFLLTLTSVAIQYHRGHKVDYFHLAFLISLAARNK